MLSSILRLERPLNHEENHMKTTTGIALAITLALTLPMAAQNSVPMLVNYGGVLRGSDTQPLTGAAGVTFLLYKDQEGGAPLWMETQNVRLDASGHYTVTLGANSSEGLPAYLFADGAARWLGVQVTGQAEEARVALVAVPYAVKARDADTIGGLPPSAFVLAGPGAATTVAAPGTKAEAARDVSPDTACTKITSDGTATANQVTKFTGACAIEPSAIFESGGKVGIGTTTPAATLDVKGTATLRGALMMNAKGAATAAAGASSNPLDLLAASFNSSNSTSISQHFRWQAEAAGNDTVNPSGTLNLLYAPGSGTPAETGLAVSSKGLVTFATGQTFPGAGTITGVTAGLGLSGGGTGGNVTLANTGVLAVAGGTGITSTGGNSPAVSLNTAFTDGRYLQLAGGTLSGALNVPINGLAAGNQLVLANGQVGINTATPSANLEVAGSVKISGAFGALTFPDGTTQTTAGNPAGVVGVNPLQVALLKWYPANQAPNATFGVGIAPTGVAFDGANIWVSNQGDGSVTVLQASNGQITETLALTKGASPYGIAFDGSAMWVANFNGSVATCYPGGGSCGGFSLGANPLGLAFDGTNMWVTNHGGNSVTKVQVHGGAVNILGTYSVGVQPYGIAFDGTYVWVANYGNNTVTRLQASSGSCLGSCTFSVGTGPVGVAFDGANIWVANNGSNNVTKLSAVTGGVVGTYNVGSQPYGLAFDGTNIWVTNSGSNTVTKLQASTGQPLGTFNVGSNPVGIAFDGANIWVANSGSNTVSKL
jgi:YVTN family beta-propeller protein